MRDRHQSSVVSRKFANRALIISVVLYWGVVASAQHQAVVLKGGKLLTVSHGVVDNGALVMEAGKISALGPAASVRIPKNAKVIDAAGMTIYPGLIDSETALGDVLLRQGRPMAAPS